MATKLLFREDAYRPSTAATVLGVSERGILLDQSVFYAMGGGQPGDVGVMTLGDGRTIAVTNAVWNDDAKTEVAHVLSPEGLHPAIGDQVELALDWPRRYARMKVHTALHLLSVALPFPVTGGSIGDGEGRLDFDIQDAGLDKDDIAARVNAMIAQAADVTERWITDAELDANPGLVKTMSVKPPRGSGQVRLVEIEGLDLQPCGGTHVRNTEEIGRIAVTQIEKKGKQNRRVRIVLA
ncbi:alanyl-tRNA editing protein [Labrys monachus]|nr:alanyl-tRNA editing protein [Labrys monachus]